MSYNYGSDGTRGHRGAVQQHLTLLSILVASAALIAAAMICYWWEAGENIRCHTAAQRARDAIDKHTVEIFRERRAFLLSVVSFLRNSGRVTETGFSDYCHAVDQYGSSGVMQLTFVPERPGQAFAYVGASLRERVDLQALAKGRPAGPYALSTPVRGTSAEVGNCLLIYDVPVKDQDTGAVSRLGRVYFLFSVQRIPISVQCLSQDPDDRILDGVRFRLRLPMVIGNEDIPNAGVIVAYPDEKTSPLPEHSRPIMPPPPFLKVILEFDTHGRLTPQVLIPRILCGVIGIALGSAFLLLLRRTGRKSTQIEDSYEENIESLEKNVGALESAVKGLEGEKRQKAVEKLAVMGLMSGGLAHELKTPLSAVQNALHEIGELASEFKGLAGEYAASTGDPEVTAEDHAEIASDMTTRAEEMGRALALSGNALDTAMRHLSTFKDKTLGMEHAERVRFDVVKAVAGALEMLLPEARANGCRIAMRRPKQPVILLGDPHKLGQIAVNLVNNAIDAYQGQPGVVSVLVRSAGDAVELVVRDEGCGIAPEDHEQIFNGTFTSKADGKGMGLGLALCREIVEAHFEGRIELESTVGKGSSFRVVLPQSNDNDPDEGESNGA